MALKVTLTMMVSVACLSLQMTTGPSAAEEETTNAWKTTGSNLNDALDWLSNEIIGESLRTNKPSPYNGKEGKQLQLEKLAEPAERSGRHLWTAKDSEESEAQNAEDAIAAAADPEGRLFFGADNNGTTVTLNLQSIQTIVVGILFVGVAILIILVIVSLVTGRDLYTLTNSFANRFTDPLANPQYYSPNYYRDESTYSSYRAFEEAAKKYEDQ